MSASQTAEPGLAEADAADGRRDVIAVALLILVTAALCLPLAEDYGVTYDEPWYVGKALYAFDWLGELLRDPRAAVSRECIDARWWARKGERREEQPGAYKLILGLTLGLGKSLLPAMAAARSATCLILCLGVGAMYAFARRAYGRTEAIAGCVAFLLMPRVFAHAHLAALDVPVAALSMVTLYAAWRAATTRNWRWTAACGIAFGVALGTKVNAVLAPIIVAIWLLASTMRRRQGAKGAPVPWRAVARVALAFAVIGPVVFVVLWPWVWHDTVQRLYEYARFQLQHYPVSTYYFGATYSRAPWHYPAVMTLVTTPPLTLLLVLIGGVGVARAAWRGSLPSTLLAVGIVVNLVVASLPSTVKYNGVRLFMPLFPLLGIVAGVGFGRAVAMALRLRRATHRRQQPPVYVALAIMLLGPSARAVAVSHPYQLSYYNVFVGGMQGAVARGLPATYWGDTYLSGWDFLTTRAPLRATLWVAPPGCRSILRMYQNFGRRRDLRLAVTPSPPPEADFAVFQNKPNEYNVGCRALLQGMEGGIAPVHVTQRCGVPLLYVFDRRAIGAARSVP